MILYIYDLIISIKKIKDVSSTADIGLIPHKWHDATEEINRGLKEAGSCTKKAVYYKYCEYNATCFDPNQFNEVGSTSAHPWETHVHKIKVNGVLTKTTTTQNFVTEGGGDGTCFTAKHELSRIEAEQAGINLDNIGYSKYCFTKQIASTSSFVAVKTYGTCTYCNGAVSNEGKCKQCGQYAKCPKCGRGSWTYRGCGECSATDFAKEYEKKHPSTNNSNNEECKKELEEICNSFSSQNVSGDSLKYMRGLGLDPHIFILNFGESYSRIKNLMKFCRIVTSSGSEYKTLNGNLASYLREKTDSELVYITSTGVIYGISDSCRNGHKHEAPTAYYLTCSRNVSPRCFSNGYTGQDCSVCGAVGPNIIIPMYGCHDMHETKNGSSCLTGITVRNSCWRCGYLEYEYTSYNHTKGHWVNIISDIDAYETDWDSSSSKKLDAGLSWFKNKSGAGTFSWTTSGVPDLWNYSKDSKGNMLTDDNNKYLKRYVTIKPITANKEYWIGFGNFVEDLDANHSPQGKYHWSYKCLRKYQYRCVACGEAITASRAPQYCFGNGACGSSNCNGNGHVYN